MAGNGSLALLRSNLQESSVAIAPKLQPYQQPTPRAEFPLAGLFLTAAAEKRTKVPADSRPCQQQPDTFWAPEFVAGTTQQVNRQVGPSQDTPD